MGFYHNQAECSVPLEWSMVRRAIFVCGQWKCKQLLEYKQLFLLRDI